MRRFDYVDVDAIISGARYAEEGLLSLVERTIRAWTGGGSTEALAAVDHLSDDRFGLYGLSAAQG